MISFILSAIKIIFLLGFLIFIHELGHFTVAKLCKVRVNEFAIGFGPAIWKKQGKQTKYALRLIPLGGFVSMEGEEERSEESGSFSKASIPKRIAIVAAGAIVNIIFAIIVYFLLIANSGTYITNEIVSTTEGYPAQQIGLQSGDKIIEANNKKIDNLYDLNKAIQENTESINLKIDREGTILEYNIVPKQIAEQQGERWYLGVNLKRAEDTIGNRCLNAAMSTKEFVFSIVDNLKQLFTGNVGIKEFLYMMALISISLGVTNLLPIPALDGGKILILIIEAIRRKPLKEQTEINIQLLGFSILIVLSLYVTYNDIIRIF